MAHSVGLDHESRVRQVSDGRQDWTVYEHTPAYDPRRGATLVFDSPQIARRVRSFPRDWFTLPDRELMAVAENR